MEVPLSSPSDSLCPREFASWLDEGGIPTPLLDSIESPDALKDLSASELRALCREIRAEIVHTVSHTGGHLGSSLGVVELTVALHRVFEAPEDRLLWDVGHQTYVHKILTGRRRRMRSIRQRGGLSGFVKRSESEYDAFGAGHSSTSVSAALGMAAGRDRKQGSNHCVAVIGDGGITGGMAYEALNHAGFLDSRLLVVLNDNQQVSLPTQYNAGDQPPVGALSGALARLTASKQLRELREIAKGLARQLPAPLADATAKLDEYARGLIGGHGATLFEELGFYYIGPVDGHDLDGLVAVLDEIRRTEAKGPVLLHVVTQKGRGYGPAEKALDRMHGVGAYDALTGAQAKKAGPPSYTDVFADALAAQAAKDARVVGVHAAMGGGTGMNRFERSFPDRVYDVGIAEQHAVTFAAGLACEGLAPVVAIYSTFLQRAFDQVAHDVDLQKLPVRFAIDRAGLVGADGSTHAGAFDLTYLSCLPNMVVMAPSDEAELAHMVATAVAIDDGPSAFRFPRGAARGVDWRAAGVLDGWEGTPLEVGRGRVLREGTDVAFFALGTGVPMALAAAEMLQRENVSATVVDARFAKPIDYALLTRLASHHRGLVTVEEGSVGGFGSHVANFLANKGLLDGRLKLRAMTLPDRYIDHGTQKEQLEDAGLTATTVAQAGREAARF